MKTYEIIRNYMKICMEKFKRDAFVIMGLNYLTMIENYFNGFDFNAVF